MGKEKTPIKIVVFAYVALGKSTALGHLIYKCDLINKRTIKNLSLLRWERAEDAWVSDKLKAE